MTAPVPATASTNARVGFCSEECAPPGAKCSERVSCLYTFAIGYHRLALEDRRRNAMQDFVKRKRMARDVEAGHDAIPLCDEGSQALVSFLDGGERSNIFAAAPLHQGDANALAFDVTNGLYCVRWHLDKFVVAASVC